ncbi:CCA tRNA nucleotidyltransferase [Algicella marina]|uniref:CCA tRNA nucleotidyltransferase n=1 Tax=Algicella marina TaxID=2683284 RepID=A0A6P1T2M3_9RHOB|nr:CCA tRNA nucleotidyltransferase [Algicella marina]QHQ36968.1 CCA tRNA nucleotidyltransferase [Algicella marina]
MRIAPSWLDRSATRAVAAALHGRFHFVGGCVRDAVLGRDAADIDIATPLPPEEVQALAEAAGLRTVPTGIAHGTVTVIADDMRFEVTTYRRDVSTDGRRATVAFSDSLAEDAARRDFTMNALYAAADGELTDPEGGLEDLAAGLVRFIGDPSRRIREDYLRSLRFFRFYAWYGDAGQGLDPDGMAAVAANLDGIPRLSAERVGAEMRKLLAAPDPAPSVSAMAISGLLPLLLPGAEPRFLPPLVHLETEAGAGPRWQRRLAVLGLEDRTEALRLSKAEARELAVLADALRADTPLAELAYRHGRAAAEDAALVRGAGLGAMPPDWQARIALGEGQRFPLAAEDLLAKYGQGQALGAALRRLEALWIAEDFRPDRDALLVIDRDGGV